MLIFGGPNLLSSFLLAFRTGEIGTATGGNEAEVRPERLVPQAQRIRPQWDSRRTSTCGRRDRGAVSRQSVSLTSLIFASSVNAYSKSPVSTAALKSSRDGGMYPTFSPLRTTRWNGEPLVPRGDSDVLGPATVTRNLLSGLDRARPNKVQEERTGNTIRGPPRHYPDPFK